ncbi:2-phosphosulfolactate phosphatase [Balneolaceae bacterium YR4-1]|uniref:Probable 2-phosphosulfolactate phosphatase n=1 Tax=Halalkalibaculum roseum TaxID=2709311 RepID=A0A6M1SRN9_9BACT|nr:2-phosphosulfolactate phosphatase [Halalkalibaculum roseum]NGP77759.1 2-phosphosulfolactate phosphatase [Halalkalibaculum roseum]
MIKELEVFTSATSFQEDEMRGKTAVMIDVLRASSTIVTALANGAKGVIPVADMGAGSKISQSMDTENILLCGEKDGEKIEGYDLGNSPFEYTPELVNGKTIILNTTNGTKALMRASHARHITVGSFLNLGSVVEYLKDKERIILVCAGWRGRLSLEDLLCAGNIIYELTSGELPDTAFDGAKVAFGLYEKFGDDIEKTVLSSNHAHRLQDIVGTEDLSYCSRVNAMDVLPVMKEGIITDFHGKEK